MTPIRAIAEFSDPRLVAVYEAVNAYAPGTQPDFCAALAAELGAGTIVDLGCGTGLISRELARRGSRVIGVDPSTAMLELARRRPFGDRVTWICGGADAIGTPGADLAIMTGHVAQFFLTDESWADALTALHAALRPGGRLAFESRNPAARGWERWTREHAFTVEDPSAGRIESWSVIRAVSRGIVSYTNHYVFERTGDDLVSQGALRFRTLDELTHSLAAAGFAIEQLFGDWDRGPVAPTAPELIVVATR